MDQVDTLHDGTYWSEVLCFTIMTNLSDLEVKVTDFVFSSPEPKAHKVSLQDGHDPASVCRPSVVVVHNFKDLLL